MLFGLSYLSMQELKPVLLLLTMENGSLEEFNSGMMIA